MGKQSLHFQHLPTARRNAIWLSDDTPGSELPLKAYYYDSGARRRFFPDESFIETILQSNTPVQD